MEEGCRLYDTVMELVFPTENDSCVDCDWNGLDGHVYRRNLYRAVEIAKSTEFLTEDLETAKEQALRRILMFMLLKMNHENYLGLELFMYDVLFIISRFYCAHVVYDWVFTQRISCLSDLAGVIRVRADDCASEIMYGDSSIFVFHVSRALMNVNLSCSDKLKTFYPERTAVYRKSVYAWLLCARRMSKLHLPCDVSRVIALLVWESRFQFDRIY